MIFTRLQATHFRSLLQVDQTLNRFQALVGPNASGKTTYLDLLGFLSDLMRLRGDVIETTSIRSADFSKLLWKGEGSSFQIAVEAKIPDEIRALMDESKQKYQNARYEIEVGLDKASNEIGLNHETLWLTSDLAKSSESPRLEFPESKKKNSSILLKSGQ